MHARISIQPVSHDWHRGAHIVLVQGWQSCSTTSCTRTASSTCSTKVSACGKLQIDCLFKLPRGGFQHIRCCCYIINTCRLQQQSQQLIVKDSKLPHRLPDIQTDSTPDTSVPHIHICYFA
jgi:hypothetical protein